MLEHNMDKLKQLVESDDERTDYVLLLDPDSYSEVSTEKRREIIEALKTDSYCSKKELAEDLDRDVKNIHDDLEILRRNSVVELEREGRKVSPRLKHQHVAGKKI